MTNPAETPLNISPPRAATPSKTLRCSRARWLTASAGQTQRRVPHRSLVNFAMDQPWRSAWVALKRSASENGERAVAGVTSATQSAWGWVCLKKLVKEKISVLEVAGAVAGLVWPSPCGWSGRRVACADPGSRLADPATPRTTRSGGLPADCDRLLVTRQAEVRDSWRARRGLVWHSRTR
jgi:hypothetical protein